MILRLTAKATALMLLLGAVMVLQASPAAAVSMPFHEYNLCGNRCVNTTGEYFWYESSNRVISEVNEGSLPYGIILNEVCEIQANSIINSLDDLGYMMTTRYTLFNLSNCGDYGNVVLTRGTRTGSEPFTSYYTFSNPDAQHGETRRMLCVSSNAFIVFAVCGTHLANGSAAESARDNQMDQFLYLSTAWTTLGRAIGGDLNDTPAESHLDGYYNGYYEADQSNRTNPQATHSGGTKIDYVFADKSHFLTTRSLVVDSGSPDSDHYYLKAFFNI